jgi:hypothetical protein
MKRYMVFGGDYYYPRGGMNDLLESCDSVEEVRSCLADWLDREHKWFHVIDRQTWDRLSDLDIWPEEDHESD